MSQITVRVRYFNVLADYAGTKRAEVTLPAGTTVRGLLRHLAETNPARFRRALVHGDTFNASVRVFRNDRLVAGEDFEARIAEGDEFMLFPAVAGGEQPQGTQRTQSSRFSFLRVLCVPCGYTGWCLERKDRDHLC